MEQAALAAGAVAIIDRPRRIEDILPRLAVGRPAGDGSAGPPAVVRGSAGRGRA
ncbi:MULTISPECIES: hypothetical protein [unclassified Streptomyces]|uniref:hypothetical protein n=1 Tax=unclassified Streptomyces TaxID=2593676 RepID=UPI0033B92D16